MLDSGGEPPHSTKFLPYYLALEHDSRPNRISCLTGRTALCIDLSKAELTS
jgi:hypothetical protein